MGKLFQIAPEKDNKKTMRRKGSNPLHVKMRNVKYTIVLVLASEHHQPIRLMSQI